MNEIADVHRWYNILSRLNQKPTLGITIIRIIIQAKISRIRIEAKTMVYLCFTADTTKTSNMHTLPMNLFVILLLFKRWQPYNIRSLIIQKTKIFNLIDNNVVNYAFFPISQTSKRLLHYNGLIPWSIYFVMGIF